MDINKLAYVGKFKPGHILYKITGGYASMMDNSCKKVDGHIYRSFGDSEELSVDDLIDAEKDYVILIWEDFANTRGFDNVKLKDRYL